MFTQSYHPRKCSIKYSDNIRPTPTRKSVKNYIDNIRPPKVGNKLY